MQSNVTGNGELIIVSIRVSDAYLNDFWKVYCIERKDQLFSTRSPSISMHKPITMREIPDTSLISGSISARSDYALAML